MPKLYPETIEKITSIAMSLYDSYMEELENNEYVKMSFSNGNDKIGHTLNVSTMPGFTCRNFKECINTCYAERCASYHGKSVIDAWIRNTVILKVDRDRYFREIDEKMTRRRTNKFFRWHVSGDIPDYDYFVRMVEIAKKHPDFKIWTYTKNYWFVNKYCDTYGRDAIPENFSFMFSAWPGCKMKNPYNFPIFNFVPKGSDVFPDLPFCPGNCDVCKTNGGRGCIAGEPMNVREH